ncbi:MAG: hypothetical protein ACOCUU_00470 [Nanoarchaeota archaeon]
MNSIDSYVPIREDSSNANVLEIVKSISEKHQQEGGCPLRESCGSMKIGTCKYGLSYDKPLSDCWLYGKFVLKNIGLKGKSSELVSLLSKEINQKK